VGDSGRRPNVRELLECDLVGDDPELGFPEQEGILEATCWMEVDFLGLPCSLNVT
jgi:hypothetical protein